MDRNRALSTASIQSTPTKLEAPLSPVNHQLSQLDAVLEDVEATVTTMENRLVAVLSPWPSEGQTEGQAREKGAPLADKLENMAARTATVRDRLQSILQRLAL